MQVRLKNNVFTATQWFKDGDHPAVELKGNDSYGNPLGYGFKELDLYKWDDRIVEPGDWIVEMFDGLHLYSDEVFKNLFTEEGWPLERKETITMLREVCEEYGDNEWPDNLYLADIIEKHLWRHLEKE